MKAFFTQILFKPDGSFDRSTSGYDSLNLAEQAFHQAMASAMGKTEYKKVIMLVFDESGVIKFRRVWSREEA